MAFVDVFLGQQFKTLFKKSFGFINLFLYVFLGLLYSFLLSDFVLVFYLRYVLVSSFCITCVCFYVLGWSAMSPGLESICFVWERSHGALLVQPYLITRTRHPGVSSVWTLFILLL